MEGEAGEAKHNHRGEKKLVLKKVKKNTKKIKDKIRHGGHAHDGEDYDDDAEDRNLNPCIDREEFMKVMTLMQAHNRQGADHSHGLRAGHKLVSRTENGGLLEYFFGKDGKTPAT